MTGVPAPTLYHRWLGWHAPAMRRAIAVLIAGLIVAVVLLPFTTSGLAVAGGWNAAALAFLLSTWPIIIRADSSRAPQFATRDDQTEGSARVLLVTASVATLLGAGYALHLAGQQSGPPRVLLIGAAGLTVVLSWAVINTVHAALRRPALPVEAGRHRVQHRRRPAASQLPRLRYVAFTIGMTYQVSDTALRDPQIRPQYLPTPSCPMCSAVFGVVIVGGSVNLISGLFH